MSKEQQSVVIEREMPHPPEKVWRALTQSAMMEEWLMKNDFEPTVGRHFNLRSTPMPQWDGVIDCDVIAIEPPTRLAYSWKALGVDTVVTFTLTPTKTGTLLRMEQSGFSAGQERNLQGARYGWQQFLGKLETVLARG